MVATIGDKISLRHFALKGISDVLLTSKGGNKSFPTQYPQCNVVPLLELTIGNNISIWHNVYTL